MMQQIQQPCSACGQTGYSVPASDKCGSCAGKGLTPEKKVFDVHIEKVRLLHPIRHVHACWFGQETHAGLAWPVLATSLLLAPCPRGGSYSEPAFCRLANCVRLIVAQEHIYASPAHIRTRVKSTQLLKR